MRFYTYPCPQNDTSNDTNFKTKIIRYEIPDNACRFRQKTYSY